jgi:glycosyltransferase involved in cell wall biosynthesis
MHGLFMVKNSTDVGPPRSLVITIPVIGPLTEKKSRPRYSVMIPAYRKPEYLERSLNSILQQDPGEDIMEIEVVENCSPHADEIKEIVERVGRGRVGYFRQSENIGPPLNWTSCVERARGEWVHIFHDDDMMGDGFYKAADKLIETHPELAVIAGRIVNIDSHDEWIFLKKLPDSLDKAGIIRDPVFDFSHNCWILTTGALIKRDAYEAIGGYSPEFTYSYDWEFLTRLSQYKPMAFLTYPYLQYRLHEGSLSHFAFTTGDSFNESIAIHENALLKVPKKRRKRSRKKFDKAFSKTSKSAYRSLWKDGYYREALGMSLWWWRFERSHRSVIAILKSGFMRLFSLRKRTIEDEKDRFGL